MSTCSLLTFGYTQPAVIKITTWFTGFIILYWKKFLQMIRPTGRSNTISKINIGMINWNKIRMITQYLRFMFKQCVSIYYNQALSKTAYSCPMWPAYDRCIHDIGIRKGGCDTSKLTHLGHCGRCGHLRLKETRIFGNSHAGISNYIPQ